MRGKDTAKKDIERTAKAIRAGDRVALARAITLVESAKPEDQARAEALLDRLLPHTGKSDQGRHQRRPRSRQIDPDRPAWAEPRRPRPQGRRARRRPDLVAERRLDPRRQDPHGQARRRARSAFIRPSPAGDSLGGVTKTTRETIALAEAAGYDVVLVETVGVGQSETAVANMVDVFVVVAIPGAGDELQGIKRGLLELADIVAVNKADGDQVERANRAAMEYRTALHILAAGHANWDPQVLTLSARDNKGLDELWAKIDERHAALAASGALNERRSDQAASWMREIFEQRLLAAFKGGRRAARHFQELEDKVRAGEMTPAAAAHELGRLAGIKDAD